MEPTTSWPVRRFDQSAWESLQDAVISEGYVRLFLNGKLLSGFLCLPCDLEALALGFLLTEGVVSPSGQLPEVRIDPQAAEVHVRAVVDAEAAVRPEQWRTSSGGFYCTSPTGDWSGLSGFGRLDTEVRFSPGAIADAVNAVQENASLFRATGGTHAAALASADGRLLLLCEDVGRYNAFDKVVGSAVRQRIGLQDKAIVTTGRVPLEIAAKAIRTSIPLVVSMSAPTSCALALADRFGVTVVGFARGTRMNVYTHARRVSEDAR